MVLIEFDVWSTSYANDGAITICFPASMIVTICFTLGFSGIFDVHLVTVFNTLNHFDLSPDYVAPNHGILLS